MSHRILNLPIIEIAPIRAAPSQRNNIGIDERCYPINACVHGPISQLCDTRILDTAIKRRPTIAVIKKMPAPSA
jgi:hypothetical protein